MRKPPTPGELRHNVTIIRDVVTDQDEHGQPITTPLMVESVYCKVEPLAGRDVEYARQQYHLATHRITMRYTASLTTTTRIQFGTRVFHVGHITNPEERNQWLVALCSEGADKHE